MRGVGRAAIAVLISALAAAPASAEDRIGQIKSAEGEVTIDRKGTMTEGAPGEALFRFDVIRTGADGVVGMTFTDNSRMSLGPSSELAIEKYLFSGRQKAFDARLTKGSMTAASGQIAKTPQAMRILLPGGILGVRGTEIAVRANP